jgi:hypothetical protein
MTATTESPTNVGKAYEACEMWDELPMSDLPPAVRAVSSVLHATCLARVGRDDDALQAYETCLDHNQESTLLEPKTLQDAIIGRSSALQRLMRYDEAIEQFLLVQDEHDRGTLGAVTCCMRLGQLERATRILEERKANKQVCATLALLTILQGAAVDDDAVEALQAAAPESPLFQWLANVVGTSPSKRQYDYDALELAAINQSPFDDPLLLHLDDKILLHRLLEKNGDLSFWPKGFILPGDNDSFQRHVAANEQQTTRKDWILKSRAGYGSHGNKIVFAKEVLGSTSPEMESRLCQRLVDPPLLLLDGRKFSVRVYVYSFVDGSSVYLSNQGLVKIASQAYDANDDDDDSMHMTNSGREDTMMQYDFDYLRDTFDREGWSFYDFWDKIRQAVTSTMRCYQIECNEQQLDATSELQRCELAKLGIPKILGFDFMATSSNDRRPMLLEVNRFPGLEAREEGDGRVKQTVVKEAWVCAANRLSTENCFGSIHDKSTSEEVSYERLSIS